MSKIPYCCPRTDKTHSHTNLSPHPWSCPVQTHLKLSLHCLRSVPHIPLAPLLSSPQLSCHQPSSSGSGRWIVLSTGLADRPFLSRQERPPPKRPPTCWCPLEARASPAPPVRPNQGPDRGEPACEITPLSCSHWARDTLHPCRSSVQPPPHPAPILHRMSMDPFWRKKKKSEKRSKRRIQGNKEATA